MRKRPQDVLSKSDVHSVLKSSETNNKAQGNIHTPRRDALHHWGKDV